MISQTSNLSFESFAARTSAALIDLVLLTLFVFLLKFAFPDAINFLFFDEQSTYGSSNNVIWALDKFSLFLLWYSYAVIMECTAAQGTIGKQCMNLIVIDENGERISFLKSLHRNLFKMVSQAVLCLGFLSVLFNRKRQAWHDVAAKTFVVKTGS